MWPTARYVTGMNRDMLSEGFFRDRSSMRGHAAPDMEKVAADLPHQEGQLRLMLGWVEDLLAGPASGLATRTPRLADFALYQRLWWLKALDGKAAPVLTGYPRIADWMARIASHRPRPALRTGAGRRAPHRRRIGAGAPAFNRRARRHPARPAGPRRNGGFRPRPVEGKTVHATPTEITIRRQDPKTGQIHVHFPRLGYEVTVL